MNYLSDKVLLELESKGYRYIDEYPKDKSKFGFTKINAGVLKRNIGSYNSAKSFAQELRKRDYYACIFANTTAIRGCPSFCIFYKKKQYNAESALQ